MRIAIAQVNPTVGDLEGNYQVILENVRKAQENGAGLLIFGAHALTGAPLEGLLDSEAFLAKARSLIDRLAAECAMPTLITAPTNLTIEDEDGSITEAIMPELFMVFEGQCHSMGHPLVDQEIPGAEINDETVVVQVEDRFAEDLELAGVSLLVEMGADAFGEEHAAPAAKGQLNRLASLARTNHCSVAYVNITGASDSVVYGGGSVLLSSDGDLVHACPIDEPEFALYDTEGYLGELANLDDSVVPDMEAQWRMLVMATADYVKKNGFTDVVLGLSGGIDSAVTAAVAVDALGPHHVHGVLMPGPYSSEGSIVDAEELASNLGIFTQTIPIDAPFDTFKDVLGQYCGGEVKGLAAENLQARIRTVYLMALSNTYGWMLLNTGNKSEAAMGFSTLYGDTAGAFAPLGDLYKTEVYALARYRSFVSASIPVASIKKAPSAELYEGAKDEDRLPPYDELDKLLKAHVEEGMSAVQLLAEGYDASLINQVLRAVRRNEFKRRAEPTAPHLHGKAFTQDRAWPVTNGWCDEL